MLPFDKIPFSTYGSYSVISKGRDGAIYIRDIHRGDYDSSKVYKLCIADFEITKANVCMTPWELVFTDAAVPSASVKFVITEDSSVYAQVRNTTLSLEVMEARYDTIVEIGAQEWEHQLYAKNRKFRLHGQGQIKMQGEWHVVENKNSVFTISAKESTAEFVIQNYLVIPPILPFASYAQARDSVQKNYMDWESKFEKEANNSHEELARFILWGNFVKATGCLAHDAMYMTKGVMNNIWSWDNCFGALALAKAHPRQAWQQIDLLLRWQDESGALPDYVNDRFVSYSCQKPPIYGITMKQLRKKNDYFSKTEIMHASYEAMKKMANFWLDHRSDNKWGLPCYFHGNDSGWDNASVFHNGVPICTPDLSAFLIQQMDTLAVYAKELQLAGEELNWTSRADSLYNKIITYLYDKEKERFVSKKVHDEDEAVDCEADSLINYLPIVVAYRMPKEMVSALVNGLQERFVYQYGLATETRQSKYYKKGGYWQGPIWAPVTYIFVEALKECGYTELATDLAQKFCTLPDKGLMAENFDPETGEGYDDNSFAWTAAVYHLFNNSTQ